MRAAKRSIFPLLIILAFGLIGFIMIRNRKALLMPARTSNNGSATTQTGTALVTDAKDITGPFLTVSDPSSLRRFETVLPPTFKDENGTYPGIVAGESVTVHLGMAESLNDDRASFHAIPRLDQFSETTMGQWTLFMAHEHDRWIARAVIADPEYPGNMTHAIECLAAPHSDRSFWEGCKAMITNATITIIPGDLLTK